MNEFILAYTYTKSEWSTTMRVTEDYGKMLIKSLHEYGTHKDFGNLQIKQAQLLQGRRVESAVEIESFEA